MFDSLKLEQLEHKFAKLRPLKWRPKTGWIKTIRSAHKMSAAQLAKKLGVSRVSVTKAEKSEIEKTIMLSTLENIAQALNCDLHYVLVPKVPIHDYIQSVAITKAKVLTQEVRTTMMLEKQNISDHESQRIYQNFVKKLEENPHKLWDEAD